MRIQHVCIAYVQKCLRRAPTGKERTEKCVRQARTASRPRPLFMTLPVNSVPRPKVAVSEPLAERRPTEDDKKKSGRGKLVPRPPLNCYLLRCSRDIVEMEERRLLKETELQFSVVGAGKYVEAVLPIRKRQLV